MLSHQMDTPPLIYLASRSPRRVELLKQIGLSCAILPADIDETQHLNETPVDYVMRLAQQKVEAGLQRLRQNSAHMRYWQLIQRLRWLGWYWVSLKMMTMRGACLGHYLAVFMMFTPP